MVLGEWCVQKGGGSARRLKRDDFGSRSRTRRCSRVRGGGHASRCPLSTARCPLGTAGPQPSRRGHATGIRFRARRVGLAVANPSGFSLRDSARQCGAIAGHFGAIRDGRNGHPNPRSDAHLAPSTDWHHGCATGRLPHERSSLNPGLPDGRSARPDEYARLPDEQAEHPDKGAQHPDEHAEHPTEQGQHPSEGVGRPTERSGRPWK
jgi:hypothetical protein